MPPNDREFNLLSNGAVESFWDALWLGIEAFLCFMEESRSAPMLLNDRELNLLSNGAVESFWDAVWLGIGPFLCFILISIDFR